MKPVIKKQTHYNILFMTDDGDAKTYRMRGGLLRFLFLFPLVLTLVGGAVVAAGVHYAKNYLELRSGYAQQEKEISEMRLQLERLTNLETLLSASSGSGAMPLAKHEEVGAAGPVGRSGNATTTDAAPAAQAFSNATSGAADPDPAAPQTVADDAAPAPDNGAAPADAAVSPAAETVSTLPLLSSEESPVRISNFSGRPIGQQRVRIRYELSASNNEEGKMLSGLARHFAIFTNGERAELPSQDNADIRFAITRMKPMEATARLPQGYETKDIKQIDVVIVVEDVGSFHDYFELTPWRSY
jgi:hypothetical protein